MGIDLQGEQDGIMDWQCCNMVHLEAFNELACRRIGEDVISPGWFGSAISSASVILVDTTPLSSMCSCIEEGVCGECCLQGCKCGKVTV